jgi:hypothetical protein
MHLEWVNGSNARKDVGGTTHTSFYFQNGVARSGLTSFFME